MKPIDKQAFPMTVAQFADAAGVCGMRVYRMVKAGQLKVKPGRPLLILGWQRKGKVSKRVWVHRVREAAAAAKLPRHKWGIEADGTFLLFEGDGMKRIPAGITVWALEAAVSRIAENARK